ncbi:MAG: HXXEE domain-containing protein [Chitinophagaceae bacterium]|nr:MAG: HXXEE domain-containing protein [Chitinophagaceae bacterium]
MNFLRNHWYDLGGFFALLIGLFLVSNYASLTAYQLLMWVSVITLFLHQLEEYRIVGTFPRMVNSILFKSSEPHRFPLNTNTSLMINVWLGWVIYLLAAIFAEKCVWLGMASILVSLGNIIAHTFIFNIKGKTFYNAGMVTSLFCFAPCVYFFFKMINQLNLAKSSDYIFGIVLGLVLNIAVVVSIKLLARNDSPYSFPNRNVLPKDRN